VISNNINDIMKSTCHRCWPCNNSWWGFNHCRSERNREIRKLGNTLSVQITKSQKSFVASCYSSFVVVDSSEIVEHLL